MFKVETTIILGAGASKSYGYPLGDRLISDIITLANPNNSTKPHYPFNDASTRLYNSLRFYDPLSIDSFLYHYRHDEELINEAKKMIAQILIQSPVESNFLRSNINPSNGERLEATNWYRNLWDAIVSEKTAQELTSEDHDLKFQIVTFNYDSSLEYFFHSRIFGENSMFTNKQKPVFFAKILERIQHVYGCIHSYEPNKNGNYKQIPIFKFDAERAYLAASECYDKIQLINERIASKYDSLQSVFDNPVQVIFLGFGFDDINISNKVLNLQERLKANVINSTRTLRALKYTNYQDSEKINRKINKIVSNLGKQANLEVVKSVNDTYTALEKDFSLNNI